MSRVPISLALCMLAGVAAAQTQTVVSPLGYATADGNRANGWPVSSRGRLRYQQLHSDLPARSYLIRKLGFRPDAGGKPFVSKETAVIDCEMYMGVGVRYDRVSTRFDANYLTGKALVMARKKIQLPALGRIGSTPGPFAVEFALDRPYLFAGGPQTSLLWALRVHSNAVTGYRPAMDSVADKFVAGSYTKTGLGCVAPTQPGPFSLHAVIGDCGGYAYLGLGGHYGPSKSPVVAALGTANPRLRVPGLCGPLYTDLAVVVPAGMTTEAGWSTALDGFWFSGPNVLANQTVYAQLHALDRRRTDPIQVANSGGVAATFPAAGTPKVLVSRMFSLDGPTATIGKHTGRSTIGYGVVTRFTY